MSSQSGEPLIGQLSQIGDFQIGHDGCRTCVRQHAHDLHSGGLCGCYAVGAVLNGQALAGTKFADSITQSGDGLQKARRVRLRPRHFIGTHKHREGIEQSRCVEDGLDLDAPRSAADSKGISTSYTAYELLDAIEQRDAAGDHFQIDGVFTIEQRRQRRIIQSNTGLFVQSPQECGVVETDVRFKVRLERRHRAAISKNTREGRVVQRFGIGDDAVEIEYDRAEHSAIRPPDQQNVEGARRSGQQGADEALHIKAVDQAVAVEIGSCDVRQVGAKNSADEVRHVGHVDDAVVVHVGG